VYPTKALALEGIKYAANIFREDMSVADEAIMMRELFQVECGKDIERLAALVGKTIGYCSDRLNLVDGDELVFDALRKREIGIGVAQTLNEIPAADYRRYYLSLAVRDGWKKSMAVDAVTQWKKLYGDALPTPLPASTPSGPIIASTYDPHRCEVCGKNDPRFIPEHISVHTHCKLAVLDPMLEAYRGNGGPST
jgi:ParB-like chromosome segregation protein Spo0J